MDDMARNDITLARQMSSNGSYSKAFELYIRAIEKSGHIRAVFEVEFCALLHKCNDVLIASNKIEELFKNFARALKLYPNNTRLLNEVGKHLYKYGFYVEAWRHFEDAVLLDHRYVDAEKNLNSLKNFLVERWHFRMLNDKIRNDAYHKAISESVQCSDTVMDIGTGTGLLALYANESYPLFIFACDGSKVMSKLAQEVIDENNAMSVFIINKMSTDMNHLDAYGKKSLVVTELFDAGLFGEHVLQTLSHAWEHLICSNGRVIPNRAEFFVIGAKSNHLAKNYQLCNTVKKILNVADLNVHIISYEETYDCDDVHLLKDIKYMTEAESLLKVDFNNYYDILEKLNKTEPYDINFKIKENGEINTVIGYFNLYLTDNVTITTDPRSENRANAWQQAVFFDNIPIPVTKNESSKFQFLVNGGKLKMLPNNQDRVFRISLETLRFLNDTEFLNMIDHCIGVATVYLGQLTSVTLLDIVDLCPFPYFGLLMLKRGAQKLVCYAKTISEKLFLKKVLQANQIPLRKVTVLLGDDWTEAAFKDDKFHAIFCNVFELCGEVDMSQRELSQHLKANNLVEGGLFLPSNVTVMCQIVSSHWFDINNKVYDKNAGEYNIGSLINKYRVTQNINMDFSNLEYTALSAPTSLGIWNDRMSSTVINVPIIKNGNASAILCWYNIELIEDLGEISTMRERPLIDGIAFIPKEKHSLIKGKNANVLLCVDSDKSFKLVLETGSSC